MFQLEIPQTWYISAHEGIENDWGCFIFAMKEKICDLREGLLHRWQDFFKLPSRKSIEFDTPYATAVPKSNNDIINA